MREGIVLPQMHADRRRFFSCILRVSRLHPERSVTRSVGTAVLKSERPEIFETMDLGLPNQSVERTRMSRLAQCQLQRQRRLIPVAQLFRSASASDAGTFGQEATEGTEMSRSSVSSVASC